MRGRSMILENYGWNDAETELAEGIHPEVVAARLGENVTYLLKVADEHHWPIRWQPHALPTADKMLERFNALYGFNA